MFSLPCVRQKHLLWSGSFYIEPDDRLSLLLSLYRPIVLFILYCTQQLHHTPHPSLLADITPSGPPFLPPLLFLFNSCFLPSFPGPPWQIPPVFLPCLIFSRLYRLLSLFLPLWGICTCVYVGWSQTSCLKTEGIKIDFSHSLISQSSSWFASSVLYEEGRIRERFICLWDALYWWRRRLKDKGTYMW